ncbi:hypothetical protein BS47DRAFT_1387180 [Hydnum rufescens UP504]|uniref:DNA2/NAM7 helicase-like C-terminal domain-containing protein n=1 Tax=Hydnum rufescens UP504 TaxID=1448309 RepID=A0A9P6BA45_9AGAM|nr:hypothetical protein BS47DRAFT_1387180 [Hydnum rufescens UP504]
MLPNAYSHDMIVFGDSEALNDGSTIILVVGTIEDLPRGLAIWRYLREATGLPGLPVQPGLVIMPSLCRELRDCGVTSIRLISITPLETTSNDLSETVAELGEYARLATYHMVFVQRAWKNSFEHCLSAAHLTLASDRPETVEKFALHNQLIKHETSRSTCESNQYLESISLAHPELLVNVLIDFGVVDPLKQASTMAINLNLVESMDVTLVDIQMASAAEDLNFPRQNHFTPSSWRGRIRFPGDYGLPLEFQAKGLGGRFEDRIRLDVLAVVSIKDDLDKLRPTSPYQQPSSRFSPRTASCTRDEKANLVWRSICGPLASVPDPMRTFKGHAFRPEFLADISCTYRSWSAGKKAFCCDRRQDLCSKGCHEDLGTVDMSTVLKGIKYTLGSAKNFSNTTAKPMKFNFRSLERHYVACTKHCIFRGTRLTSFPQHKTTFLICEGDSRMAIDDLQLYNRQLNNNPPSKDGCRFYSLSNSRKRPFRDLEPGKTVVVVEAMRQILDRNPEARLLACAPSNSAADLLADRLRQSGIMPSQLLRLNRLTRPLANLSPTLLPYSKSNEGSFIIPDLHALKEYRVVISTCITASVLHAVGIPDDTAQDPRWTHTNVVLAGDPKQLGPIVRSQYARKLGLHVSYLQRLIAESPVRHIPGTWKNVSVLLSPAPSPLTPAFRRIVKLVQNFRSHPAILKFPSDRFYNGELEPCGNPIIINSLERWDRLVTPGFPIIFHAVNGEDHREEKSPSWFNPIEVTVVKQYVQALRENQKLRLTDNDIGVITPYHKQGRKILSAINTPELKRGRPGILKVGSVEDFQGQERRVIIVSCGRSNKNFIPRKLAEADPTAKGKRASMRACLGFVAEPARFNVAMTRAQALLICIGDPTVLSLDKMWRKFLDYIHARGGWKGIPKDWSAPEPGTEDSRDFVSLRLSDARRVMDDLGAEEMEAVLNGDNDASSSNSDLEEQPWREPE